MGNVESSLNLAKQLLRMGRNSADRDAEVEGLKLLAAAYEQQGDFNSGLLLLQVSDFFSVTRQNFFLEYSSLTEISSRKNKTLFGTRPSNEKG